MIRGRSHVSHHPVGALDAIDQRHDGRRLFRVCFRVRRILIVSLVVLISGQRQPPTTRNNVSNIPPCCFREKVCGCLRGTRQG